MKDQMKSGSRPPRELHSYSLCFRCQRVLTRDEIALTRKLINRGTQTFFCLSCLAAHFQVTEDILREKIVQFREMGCTLFDP